METVIDTPSTRLAKQQYAQINIYEILSSFNNNNNNKAVISIA